MGFKDIIKLAADRLKSHPLIAGEPRSTPVTTQEAAQRDPTQIKIKRVGLSEDPSNRDYTSPGYTGTDFTVDKIEEAWNKESYYRRACSKYTELMFKAGWDLTGKNPNAVQYIRQRWTFMAECMQQPLDIWLLEQSEDLVKYHNVILAKSRMGDVQWPQGLKVQGLGGQDPALAYFILPVKDIQVKRDKAGNIKGWQQDVGGETKKFKPTDIVHMYYQRERGKVFGTPFIVPVLDDIISLRQAEENVLRLIYRNLFPFLHYKVGSEGEHGQPGEDREVEQLRAELENMEPEGGLATTERVNIEPIALDQIIDACSYLLYFERRVFTGLGMSEAQMGRGATSARATAENMQDQVIDEVKALQRVQEAFINEMIIKEQLMEGGFDPVLNPDDGVYFLFKEIDVDMKIKKENHAIFQFEHNSITEDEMRALLGRDPITDRSRMFCELVTIRVTQAEAEAKATYAPSQGSSSGTKSRTPKGNSKGGSKTSTGNKVAPTNKPKNQATSLYQELAEESIRQEFEGLRKDTMTITQAFYAGEDGHRVGAELAGILAQSKKNLLYTVESYLGEEAAQKAEPYFDNLLERLNIMIVTAVQSTSSPVHSLHTIASFFDIYDSNNWKDTVNYFVLDVNYDNDTNDYCDYDLVEEVIALGSDLCT